MSLSEYLVSEPPAIPRNTWGARRYRRRQRARVVGPRHTIRTVDGPYPCDHGESFYLLSWLPGLIVELTIEPLHVLRPYLTHA